MIRKKKKTFITAGIKLNLTFSLYNACLLPYLIVSPPNIEVQRTMWCILILTHVSRCVFLDRHHWNMSVIKIWYHSLQLVTHSFSFIWWKVWLVLAFVIGGIFTLLHLKNYTTVFRTLLCTLQLFCALPII